MTPVHPTDEVTVKLPLGNLMDVLVVLLNLDSDKVARKRVADALKVAGFDDDEGTTEANDTIAGALATIRELEAEGQRQQHERVMAARQPKPPALVEIMEAAGAAYDPDETIILDYFGDPDGDHGDTLAKWVVLELKDTTDGGRDVGEGIGAIRSGIEELERVAAALERVEERRGQAAVQAAGGKPFSVIEYSSFFAVRDNATGREHPMGDGVDSVFDAEGQALSPGTPGFIEAWEAALNEQPHMTREAYFSDPPDDE